MPWKSKNGNRKNGNRKNVKYNKRKRQPRRLFVNKSVKSTLNKMISRKLDSAIEDKYLLDTSFTEHQGSYDTSTHSLTINVSPNIVNGDEVNNRTGNRVRLKYLRTFFRMLPEKNAGQAVVDSTSPSYTSNFFAQKPDVTVYLVRVNNEMIQHITPANLRVALNAKFRSDGHCWQDYAQSSGKNASSAIKLLEKFKLKKKYREMICPFTPLNAGGTITGDPAYEFTFAPTYQATCTGVQVPQYTYHNMYCNKVSQKIEIQDSTNSPIKYQYWYFVQFGSGYNDQTYNPLYAPEKFEIRNCWVFEDA